MCTMVPMRSVPHRVICLLGLDDGRFPRTASVDGDDVLARDPWVGERDPRSEDRQLLLDAILAAQDHLVVLYTGADPRTNARRPPAVPVGEILDAADALAVTADGARRGSRSSSTTRCSRSTRATSSAGRSNRCAAVQPRPAGAGRRRPRDPGPRAARPVPASAAHPAGRAGRPGPRRPDRLPGAPGQGVPSAAARGHAGPRRRRAGRRPRRRPRSARPVGRGRPAAGRGWPVPTRRRACRPSGGGRPSRPASSAGASSRASWPRSTRWSSPARTSAWVRRRVIDVAVEVAGRRVVGTVGGVYGDTVVRVEYSRLGPKHRLRAWAQLLALTTAQPDASWTAVTIGRDRRSGVGAFRARAY